MTAGNYGFDNTGEGLRRAAAAREGAEVDRAREHARVAEDKIERLTLVCMAMWSLMQDKLGVTEAELLQRVKDLDLVDGVPDGKATRGVMRCPKCDRPLHRRHKKCLYCGAAKLVQSAFDTL